MIVVVYKGQLGNNLFQYCLGRLLAHELGYALDAAPIAGFPNTQSPVDGRRFGEPSMTITGHHLQVAELRRRRPQCRIVLHGWFQRSEYYRPHRDDILRWLAFDDRVRRPDTRPRTVVHVRRNDYVTNGWALPFSFYEESLARLGEVGDLWILTDDPRDPFFDRFARWRPRFAAGSALEDLRMMSMARRIVMSQSTYSWWAAFLGEPEQVICPVPSFGAWSPSGEEASLIERDRFTCVPCEHPYRPTLREAFYQRRRAVRPAIARAVRRVIPVPTLTRS